MKSGISIRQCISGDLKGGMDTPELSAPTLDVSVRDVQITVFEVVRLVLVYSPTVFS